MNLFINYRKVFTYSSKIELTGSQLKVKAGFPDEQTYDLNDIIARYGEDHGCIALAIGHNTGTLIWHETTRMSYVYRTPMGKSYTSLLQDNYSINYDKNNAGQHNAASPAWVLTEAGNLTPVLFVMTPFRGCTVDDVTIVYHSARYPDAPEDHVPSTHEFYIDGVLQTNVTEMPSIKEWLSSWLPVNIDGPSSIAPNSTATFTISAATQADIYVSATCGVINRLVAKNGQTLMLDTRGLVAGDVVEIKSGYKFWPGISRKTVAVG